MLLREFRIILPLTVEEYQVAQLYTVAETSKNETGGGDGVKIIKNEPFSNKPLFENKFDKGQYTYKEYHVGKKLPAFLRSIGSSKYFTFYEEAWNAYPYCKTIISNQELKDSFMLKIETIHKSDRGTSINPLHVNEEEYKNVDIVYINIADGSHLNSTDRHKNDPQKFHSVKTDRGPLINNWQETCQPYMCCYKLVSVNFVWFGLQTRVEKFLMDVEKRLFTNFHRQLFCLIDQWYGLTMQDIRDIEARTKKELEKKIETNEIVGTVEN